MIDGAFTHPESVIPVSAALVGVAALVSSLEWLALRGEMAPEGGFAWRLNGSRSSLMRHRRLARTLSLLLELPGVLVVLGARAASAVLLIAASVFGLGVAVPLVALAVTSALLRYRHVYALDGSDQMILVVVIGLAVGTVLGAESLAVAFIAAQAAAAYFTAGLSKLRGLDWRGGDAVPLILSTRSFGTPPVGALLSQRRWVGRGVTWTTMSFEVLFPLALLAPGGLLVGFLVAGALFHIGAAVAMGLNVFPWAFLATYPCLIYLAQQL